MVVLQNNKPQPDPPVILHAPFPNETISALNHDNQKTYDPFRIRPSHARTGKPKLHAGVDYGVDIGTPVKAIGNGQVVYTGGASGYGYLHVVSHGHSPENGWGVMSLYAHTLPKNQAKADLPGMGDFIKQGDIVAFSGSQGTHHAHLHLGVMLYEKDESGTYTAHWINPEEAYGKNLSDPRIRAELIDNAQHTVCNHFNTCASGNDTKSLEQSYGPNYVADNIMPDAGHFLNYYFSPKDGMASNYSPLKEDTHLKTFEDIRAHYVDDFEYYAQPEDMSSENLKEYYPWMDDLIVDKIKEERGPVVQTDPLPRKNITVTPGSGR